MGGKDFDPADIYTISHKAFPSKILLAHNHHLEKLKARSHDIAITKKSVECRELLDIEVYDHLMLS